MISWNIYFTLCVIILSNNVVYKTKMGVRQTKNRGGREKSIIHVFKWSIPRNISIQLWSKNFQTLWSRLKSMYLHFHFIWSKNTASPKCVLIPDYRVTLVVLTLFPVLQLQPFRSGRTLHSSPSIQGCIWHHHFCATIEASTQEGAALVVPATCPGKQEHLTVWERSSILFLLQQRWAAMTSQVPALTCTIWLRCVEARLSWPHRDSRQMPNSSNLLPTHCSSLSRILSLGCQWKWWDNRLICFSLWEITPGHNQRRIISLCAKTIPRKASPTERRECEANWKKESWRWNCAGSESLKLVLRIPTLQSSSRCAWTLRAGEHLDNQVRWDLQLRFLSQRVHICKILSSITAMLFG